MHVPNEVARGQSTSPCLGRRTIRSVDVLPGPRRLAGLTLDLDGWRVATRVHQSTEEDGNIGDVAFGKYGRMLNSWLAIHTSNSLILNCHTYSQHVKGNVCERADDVHIQRDARSGHDALWYLKGFPVFGL